MILKEEPMVYSKIERKINTNFNTVKMHLKNLEEDGFIKVTKTDKDKANGRPSYEASLTADGLKKVKKPK